MKDSTIRKRAFAKLFEPPHGCCPKCKTDKHIAVDIGEESNYGEIFCVKCDTVIGHYTKEEMKRYDYPEPQKGE